MKLRIGILTMAVVAASWSFYHYREFRDCGAKFCSPADDQPRIRLDSGLELPVLSTTMSEGRDLQINYLTSHDLEDLAALCAEAKEVWMEVSKELDTRRMERAVLGPTSPKSEFLGMHYLVVPLYTCCISRYIQVRKIPRGSWVFPQCPR